MDDEVKVQLHLFVQNKIGRGVDVHHTELDLVDDGIVACNEGRVVCINVECVLCCSHGERAPCLADNRVLYS